MGHDTITQTLHRQQKKKVKQCLKTQVKGFFSSFFSLNPFPRPIFASLHHKKLAVFLSPQSNSMKGSLWSAKAFYTKDFFPLPVMEAWFSHYLARASKRDINWTRNRKVTFYVMSTALWYLDCESGLGRGEGGGWWWWKVVRHAIHCWVVFFSSLGL